jgi:hypothetical protein
MTESEISTIINNANNSIGKEFATFRGCIWSENEKCFIYRFISDLDANEFLFRKHAIGNRFPLEVIQNDADLAIVKEYVR